MITSMAGVLVTEQHKFERPGGAFNPPTFTYASSDTIHTEIHQAILSSVIEESLVTFGGTSNPDTSRPALATRRFSTNYYTNHKGEGATPHHSHDRTPENRSTLCPRKFNPPLTPPHPPPAPAEDSPPPHDDEPTGLVDLNAP